MHRLNHTSLVNHYNMITSQKSGLHGNTSLACSPLTCVLTFKHTRTHSWTLCHQISHNNQNP